MSRPNKEKGFAVYDKSGELLMAWTVPSKGRKGYGTKRILGSMRRTYPASEGYTIKRVFGELPNLKIGEKMVRNPKGKRRVLRRRVVSRKRVVRRTVRRRHVETVKRNPVRPLPPREHVIQAIAHGSNPIYWWDGKKFVKEQSKAHRFKTSSGAKVVAKELLTRVSRAVKALQVIPA